MPTSGTDSASRRRRSRRTDPSTLTRLDRRRVDERRTRLGVPEGGDRAYRKCRSARDWWTSRTGIGAGMSETNVWDVGGLVIRGVELVHVHRGFDELAPSEMWAWCEDLAAVGIRLAVTVHDLDSPRLADQMGHHERLRALVHHADALFTLTDAANTELVRRWGRPATVVAHPPMVPAELRITLPEQLVADQPALVWLGACRANVDVDAAVELVERCGRCSGHEPRGRVSFRLRRRWLGANRSPSAGSRPRRRRVGSRTPAGRSTPGPAAPARRRDRSGSRARDTRCSRRSGRRH